MSLSIQTITSPRRGTPSTKSCWTSQITPVLAKVPLIAGEIGENDCAGTYVSQLASWLDSTKSASYLAWAWNADMNCASGPGLITGYNGRLTPYGVGYEDALRSG
jgi:endoglucanase